MRPQPSPGWGRLFGCPQRGIRSPPFWAVDREVSWQSLEELPGASGATGLDKQLVARSPEMIASSGLGSEFEGALRSRRQWLLEQGLAREQDGRIAYARNLLQTLERRELVARHSGSDWLIPSQFRMGRSSGATRIWMLRATPG